MTARAFSRTFVGVGVDESTEGDSLALAATSAEGGWVLTLVHHPNPKAVGRRVHLDHHRPLEFGRAVPTFGPDLPEDRRLSRAHARLTVDAQGVAIADLDSRNGTTVDGERVQQARLREGAVVGLGSSLVHLGRSRARTRAIGHPRVVHASEALADVLHDLLEPPARRCCIHGDTGTGKGLLAEEVHLATRPEAPFVSLHAATVPDASVHRVLFEEGLLARSHGGTLHLDGFDDASPALQAALLQPVGDERLPDGQRLDVCVVTTTLRPPSELLGEGRWRPDLLARLAGRIVAVPPLRARPVDVAAAVADFAGELGLAVDPDLVRTLMAAPLPGNFRELQGLLDEAVRGGGNTLTLPQRLAAPSPSATGQAPRVRIGRDGGFVEAEGRRVSLATRRVLRLLLTALLEQHLRDPAGALSIPALVAVGWPGERILPRAGSSRVYVAVTTLRQSGVPLAHGPDGYRIDPSRAVEVTDA